MFQRAWLVNLHQHCAWLSSLDIGGQIALPSPNSYLGRLWEGWYQTFFRRETLGGWHPLYETTWWDQLYGITWWRCKPSTRFATARTMLENLWLWCFFRENRFEKQLQWRCFLGGNLLKFWQRWYVVEPKIILFGWIFYLSFYPLLRCFFWGKFAKNLLRKFSTSAFPSFNVFFCRKISKR